MSTGAVTRLSGPPPGGVQRVVLSSVVSYSIDKLLVPLPFRLDMLFMTGWDVLPIISFPFFGPGHRNWCIPASCSVVSLTSRGGLSRLKLRLFATTQERLSA